MTQTKPRSLVLILARELAGNLATATFVVDPEGRLVYFNEAAEGLLGKTFAEAGELGENEWGTMWSPEDLDGTPLHLKDLPLGVALRDKIPAHRPFRISGLDGISRTIAVTAVPLFARADEFVGALAVFWELDRPGSG